MPSYLPPTCPYCRHPLNRVNETQLNAYYFNPATGSYAEDRSAGELYDYCPNCDGELYDVLQDAVSNYQSQELAPCQTQPTTS